MNYSFKLANQIRTKLLLFIDEEMRIKINTSHYSNKINKNFYSICEIRTQEESFSNTQDDVIIHLNKIKVRNSFSELQLKTHYKFQSHLKSKTGLKYHKQKTITDSPKNSDINSKNKKCFYQKNKKQIKRPLKTIIKNKKRNAKEYLKNLYLNLLNNTGLRKYYHSNLQTSKNLNIYKKSPKLKKLKKNYVKRKALRQSPIDVYSFNIKLIPCDY